MLTKSHDLQNCLLLIELFGGTEKKNPISHARPNKNYPTDRNSYFDLIAKHEMTE